MEKLQQDLNPRSSSREKKPCWLSWCLHTVIGLPLVWIPTYLIFKMVRSTVCIQVCVCVCLRGRESHGATTKHVFPGCARNWEKKANILYIWWCAEHSCYFIQSMTCICSVSISGAWYWHLGQHKSGSSSAPTAPWSPTGTKPCMRNEGAGGTVLKAAPANPPKANERKSRLKQPEHFLFWFMGGQKEWSMLFSCLCKGFHW